MNKEKNIVRNSNRIYEEVELGETGADRHYKNPLTKVFQYEYALFKAVSDMFESVDCRSMCIESLKLYFSELSHSSEHSTEVPSNGGKKNSQEGLLAEMATLVARDVAGTVTFPQANLCRAEVTVLTETDGTHTFVFGDGTYGFGVRLDMQGTGNLKGIEVFNEL